MRILVEGLEAMGGGVRTVSVLEREIRIRVNMGYATRRFVSANWQWLIVTMAGLGGSIAAWMARVH